MPTTTTDRQNYKAPPQPRWLSGRSLWARRTRTKSEPGNGNWIHPLPGCAGNDDALSFANGKGERNMDADQIER